MATLKGEPESAPRRFYADVSVRQEGEDFCVLLDGRRVRTPARAALVAPTGALAQAVAAEWAAQGEFIRPQTMPLTRLANVALDWTGRARAETAAAIAKFGETDLLCHRAARPRSLVARQQETWDPLLDWAGAALDVRLISGAGVLAHNQPHEAYAALERAAAALDDFALTGLAHGAGLAGSAIIAFALARRAIGPEAAFAAAALDELHQLETWGEDSEARARLRALADEFAALDAFFAALA